MKPSVTAYRISREIPRPPILVTEPRIKMDISTEELRMLFTLLGETPVTALSFPLYEEMSTAVRKLFPPSLKEEA